MFILLVDGGDQAPGIPGAMGTIGSVEVVAAYPSYADALDVAIALVEERMPGPLGVNEPWRFVRRMRDLRNEPRDRLWAASALWSYRTDELGSIEIVNLG